MKHALALAAVVATLAVGTACPPKPEEQALPPSGIAGRPHNLAASPSNPTTIPAGAQMPAGHPPIDGTVAGGDDGAPLPTKGAPLPNFGSPSGSGIDVGSGAAIGAGMGAGMGAGVVFTGKVVEKLDVPSYTYLRIQTPGSEEWVAVSTMSINVGDTVTINQQIVMENFPSKALGRTFPKLVMGTAIVGG